VDFVGLGSAWGRGLHPARAGAFPPGPVRERNMNDHFQGIRYERLDDGIPSGEPPSAAVRGEAEGGNGMWPQPFQGHGLSPSLVSVPPSPSGVSSQGDVRPSTAGGRKPLYAPKSGVNHRETRAR
jgi:hypothetical protein